MDRPLCFQFLLEITYETRPQAKNLDSKVATRQAAAAMLNVNRLICLNNVCFDILYVFF